MFPEDISSNLNTQYCGRRLDCRDVVSSANDIARAAAAGGAPDGAVFVAERQTAGRRGSGRVWQSPLGGLWFSVLLRPGPDFAHVSGLPMVASLALRDAVEQILPAAPDIAWPNDLMYQGKKLAGMLVEPVFEGNQLLYVVLGIGMNVNNDPGALPDNVRALAISCAAVTGHNISRAPLLAGFLNTFEPYYELLKNGKFDLIYQQWKSALGLIGENISMRMDTETVTGIVRDIHPNGDLIIHTAAAGDVHVSPDTGSLHTSKYKKNL